MRRPRPAESLRVAALVGIIGSALAAADALRPGRGFCPVEVSCEAARSSALGSVLGVPTSVLGILAFLCLLALTLLPAARARAALFPAGLVAAACGLGLVAYQAFALDGFCPLCLVADLSGIAAGLTVLVARKRGATDAGAPDGERPAARIAWAVAGVLAAAVPFLWPHPPPRPAWVPLSSVATSLSASPSDEPSRGPAAIRLVEYLNPFCAHCRATHARLARVLEAAKVPVDRERLYVWSGSRVPYWAQACVCAQDQGKERPFFRELLVARDDGRAEVLAAARRAGLDANAVAACVARGDAAERLDRVHRRVLAARIEGMPTLDVGERRLEGEQSEEELREAVSAAALALGAGGAR